MNANLIELAEWLRGRAEFSSLLTGPLHLRGKYPKRSRLRTKAGLLWVYVEGTVPHRYAADLTDDATLGLLALQAMRVWAGRDKALHACDYAVSTADFSEPFAQFSEEHQVNGDVHTIGCECDPHPYLAILRAYREAVTALEGSDDE